MGISKRQMKRSADSEGSGRRLILRLRAFFFVCLLFSFFGPGYHTYFLLSGQNVKLHVTLPTSGWCVPFYLSEWFCIGSIIWDCYEQWHRQTVRHRGGNENVVSLPWVRAPFCPELTEEPELTERDIWATWGSVWHDVRAGIWIVAVSN